MNAGDELLKPFMDMRAAWAKRRKGLTGHAGTPGAVVAVNYYRHPVSTAVYSAERTGRAVVVDRILDGDEIQAYVDEVLSMPWPRWLGGTTGVRVILQLEDGYAGYRPGELRCPSPVRELVVLHELAHCFTYPIAGTLDHSPPFVAAYLDLIARVMNPAAAQVFSDAFTTAGVGA